MEKVVSGVSLSDNPLPAIVLRYCVASLPELADLVAGNLPRMGTFGFETADMLVLGYLKTYFVPD